jgi:hypothetical protein
MRLLVFLVLFFSCVGAATPADISGQCDSAKFTLHWEDGPTDQRQPKLLVSAGGKETVLWFSGVDFAGVECRKQRPDGNPMIVLQAYCGGSACQDKDNFAIVDPSTFQVLLLPADGNRKQAKRIMGWEQEPMSKTLSSENSLIE